MNEDITESIFYSLIDMGLSEEAAYYCLKIYGEDLKNLVRRTEEDIRKLGDALIQERIKRFIENQNANQEDH